MPAFRELRKRGVFATVQKLACCQSCAHGKLSELYSSYVFFHVQDKDHCVETDPTEQLVLYLGFVFESGSVEARALAILKKHFSVEWDGNYKKRILVSPKVPPSVYWSVLRAWVRTRSIAIYWHETTAHLYAPNGVGYKRDREAFES